MTLAQTAFKPSFERNRLLWNRKKYVFETFCEFFEVIQFHLFALLDLR